MPPRIRRPKTKKELFDRLTSSEERGPFGSTVDVMFFCAAVGIYWERRESFSDSMEPMVFELFQKSMEHEALFDIMSIFETQDVEVLGDDREAERVRIFEEYANGGLALIQERIAAASGDPIDVAIRLMAEARADPDEDNHDLLGGML